MSIIIDNRCIVSCKGQASLNPQSQSAIGIGRQHTKV